MHKVIFANTIEEFVRLIEIGIRDGYSIVPETFRVVASEGREFYILMTNAGRNWFNSGNGGARLADGVYHVGGELTVGHPESPVPHYNPPISVPQS